VRKSQNKRPPLRIVERSRSAPRERVEIAAGSELFGDVFAFKVDAALGGSRGSKMSIIAWLIVGLISGFLASKVVNRTGGSLVLDIVLGIVGAIVGGFIFNAIGHSSPNGINIYSIFVSFIGAVVVLFIYHMIVGRRAL
jgi:uncharacterized membrane protein YeaQ/YmgE (transglycosylase-associated protein family)